MTTIFIIVFFLFVIIYFSKPIRKVKRSKKEFEQKLNENISNNSMSIKELDRFSEGVEMRYKTKSRKDD